MIPDDNFSPQYQAQDLLSFSAQISEPSYYGNLAREQEGMVLLLADGTIPACNLAAEKILGLTTEQIKSWTDLNPAWQVISEDGSSFKREYFPPIVAFKTGKPCLHVVMGFYKPDGELIWLAVNSQPLFHGSNTSYAVVTTFVDITQARQSHLEQESNIFQDIDINFCKQAEAALVESEKQYMFLADAIPQIVWVAQGNGKIQFTNQRWVDYCGITYEQAAEQGWTSIVHPDDFPGCVQKWRESWHEGKVYEAEFRFRRAVDGMYRWHLARALPMKNTAGEIGQWVGTITDIHDKKQTEAERDLLLHQEQAARAEAERANRIKDEFLAILSHELRSPLNPILGWTNLLKTRQLNAETIARALDTIERNAKLQIKLIDDLLDVSRILRGKLSLNLGAVDLVSVIDSAWETVRLCAEAKSIHIQMHLDKHVGAVLGDANRLQQVVSNLLSNAVKFTPNGGKVEVRLSAVTEVGEKARGHRAPSRGEHSPLPGAPFAPKPLPYAQITVKDTGKGICPEFLPHVFDYFRQADSSTTRKFGGLGLGLAIVRYLVELHGGTASADSPGEGQGATFRVQLPLLQKTEAYPAAKGCDCDIPNLEGKRILIVDDDADTREVLSFLFQESGAIATVAADVNEALTAFNQSPPDILLSDLGMPELDGYHLINHIRNLPLEQGGQIPAIALTAYAGDSDKQRILQAGFQKHINKPVDVNELLAAIAALLGGKSPPVLSAES